MSQNAPAWRVGRALLLALVFSIATISSAIAQQRQVLTGHVPQFVRNLNLQPVAHLAATNILHLAIGLPFRNQTALGQLLQQIYDPASPQYRHYLTSEQFTEQFGPTVADYQAVINFAQASGLTVTGQHADRALLDVVGTVANIEKALNVTLLVYPHPTENRNFYAPNVDPSVALAVPLLHISGLDNYALPHPNSRVMPLAGTEGGVYLGNDFRAAYVPGVSLKGTGQSVALLEYDGYYAVDITNYLHLAGVPSMTLTNILINGGPITPGGGDGEVSLDIEMAIAMAPNLSKILVYEGTNGVTAWATILTQIADDNLAKQISCSWSGGGPDPSSEQALVKMATQGQSFFNAVGDNDAFTGAIGFPSDSTNVTECGGTTLSTTGPGGSYVSEIVWNWGTPNSTGGDWGSSGGVSTYYSIPPWQQGVATTTNQGSSAMRNVPDVALTANNVYVTYNNGGNGSFGGTSCAAPLWAAFIALVNQQAATNGAAPIGFLNPALYVIGKGPKYAYCFHDTTVGGNEWSPGSPTKYNAVPGYDLCTGWGTPNGANLMQALLSLASGRPYIISAGSVVSGGNSSGVIDYDECVLLSLPVVNIGQGTATVVNATLTTSTPGVTITQPNSTYANLASGAVITNNTPFQISTSPSFVCGTPIPLSLVLSYTGGSVTNIITMPTCQCPTIQVNGGLSGVSPTQTDWLWPSGTNSTCSLPKSCSGEEAAVGTVAYNAYSFTNSSSSAVCVSVTVSTTCGTDDVSSIFSAAYLGSYNSGNLCANYLGDMGGLQGSFTGPGAFVYSFTVPAHTNFIVVVDGTYPGHYCSGYSVTVAGLLCPLDGGGSCAGISASFTEMPTNGAAPLAVTFTDTSTGTITNRFWNFGDGATTNTTTNTLLHVYSAAGTDTVTLIVSGPLGTSTNTRPNLIVVVNPAQLAVSPGNVTYGTQIAGQTSTQSFAVINTGGVTLNGTAVMQTGGSPFTVSGGSPYAVAPGHTGTVSVAFAPSVAGMFTNVVVFASNGGASTNQITGTALTPPQLMVSPPSESFGTIATGTTAQATFVVTNTGGAALSGTATITAAAFGIASGASYNLAGFGSTNVVVSFTPPTVNSFTGNVLFASTGGVSTNLVTGSGAVVPAASFTALPTNGAAPLAVTFTDTSTGTIAGRFWNFGDSTSTNVTTNTVVHSYTTGTYSVTLIVTGPLGTSTNMHPNLIAVVPPAQLVVSPTNVSYGAVIIGQTSTQTFAVIDTGGVTLTGTAAMQTGGSPFAISGGSPYNVAPGQTGTVSVAFTPAAPGAFTNTVIFTSNGGTSTNQITGTALTPAQLVVSPPSQNFGTIATGTTAQATFVVTNAGGAALSGTATITATAFGIASGASYNLAGFGSTNVVVSFTSPTANSFTGNVFFASTGGVSTNPVTGSGAVVPAASFTALPTSGAAPLAVTFMDTSTGTITNWLWNFGDSTSTNVTTNTLLHVYNAAGTDTVTLIVSGPLGASTNTQPNYIVVTPAADLVLTNTAAPNPVAQGQNLNYTLTVTNLGPSTATSVTITDALPTGVAFVSAATTQGSCTNIGGAVFYNLGNLAVATNAVVTVVVAPSTLGIITNTAFVFATTPDPNVTNNTAVAITVINPAADLSITKTGAPNPVLTSQNLTYTLVVTNLGPSAASSVTVTDALPAGVSVVSVIASAGTCTNVGGIVTCSLGNLASNATATVTIVGTAMASSSITSVTNTATISATEFDPNPSNNTATAALTVYLDSVGDGIPDWWRQQYFGGTGATTNSLSCATCDGDGTGQNNMFKYVAGLDPTNPVSVLTLSISSVTNQPTWQSLLLNPLANGRTYTPQFSTDLVDGIWLPLSGYTGPVSNGNQITITDTNAILPNEFYRIDISLP